MVSETSQTSDDDLYTLLGVPQSADSTSIDRLDRLTTSVANRGSDPRPASGLSAKTNQAKHTSPAKVKHQEITGLRPKKHDRPPVGTRPGEDSDEPVKETVHVTPIMRSTTIPKAEVPNLSSRSDAYWMYGQGLDVQGRSEGAGKDELDVKKEVEEVKEKDFADVPVVKGGQEDEGSFRDRTEEQHKTDHPVETKQGGMMGLLEQLMRSIDNTQADEGINIKQEDMSIEMTKVPTSSTADEGLTTADESFLTDTDTDTKPPRQFHVVQHQSRVKGSNKRRQRYQIVRHIRSSTQSADILPSEVEVRIEPDPVPATAFQRDLQTTFSRSALLQVNELAKVDNTSGNHLPSHLRDLFPALSDPASAITVANHLRRQFDLPLLSTKTDRVALRRAVAQMRLGIYTEIVSALILPSAPTPAPDTDDEEEKVKMKKISLVPSALQYMQKALPTAFPNEKYPIKLFLANHDVLGEIKGKVVWQDGIGKMVGGDPNGPAFRGKVSSDGLVHVFVDQ